MNKLLVTLSFLISLICLSSQSWALPPCPSSGYFDKCYGSATLKNGSLYLGEWRENKRNGQGTFTWFNPFEQYVGEFKDGLMHGRGTYTYANGDKFVGKSKNNKKHGQGTYIYGTMSKWAGDKYVGEYKNNKKHGQGKYIYASGDIYLGEFKDDKKHGQGTYNFGPMSKWAGDKYVGYFKNGKKYGQGTYTFADGTIKKGVWKDNHYVTDSDGSFGKPTSSSNSKIEGYKSFCSEIGFTPGTEKFGECVVEAMKKG